MRVSHFDAIMQAAGWTLARVAANGHHIYQHGNGATLNLAVHDRHNAERYLARYARRDLRRYGKKEAG